MLCQYQHWDVVDVGCSRVLRPPSEVAELTVSDWLPEFPLLGLGPLGHEITALNFLYALSLAKQALALVHNLLPRLIELGSSELRWIRSLTFKTLASREHRRSLPTSGLRLAIGLDSELGLSSCVRIGVRKLTLYGIVHSLVIGLAHPLLLQS